MQAYEWAEKLERDRLHKEELGIASLSALFANSNRDPKKSDPFKPEQFCFWKPATEAAQSIAPSACDAYFSLIKDNVMPAWVVPLSPIEQLKAGQTGARVSRPRAWIGEGVLLLMPRISGKVVTAQFALIDGAQGVVDVRDVDSGKWYAIDVPAEDCWELEAEFPLLESRLILP